MMCPTCYFPDNAPGAAHCAQCGRPLPQVAGAPPGYGSYDVAPFPQPQPEMPPPPQYATGGYPQVSPPYSGPPAYGIPVSPSPISVNPISGSPQPGYYPPVAQPRQRGSRVILPLTVIVVVLVIASTVIAVLKLTGDDKPTNTAATTGNGATTGPAVPGNGSVPATDPGGGGPAPQPTTPAADPRAQAASIDAVLDASIASRKKLNDAIDLVNKCTLIEKAIADLRTVGVERQDQLNNVGKFDLSAIAQGEQLRSLLKEALSYSLAADQSFVPWAQAVQGTGCSGGGEGYYAEAQRQSRNASDAKGRFLTVWNPVAAQYGLRSRSSSDI